MKGYWAFCDQHNSEHNKKNKLFSLTLIFTGKQEKVFNPILFRESYVS